MSAKASIPVELKFLGTEAGRSCPGSEDHRRHSTLQTELTKSWLLVLMPVVESEVGKTKITETQNDDQTIKLFLGFRAGLSFAQWHLLCSSGPAQPLQPSFLECCAQWDTSAPPWWTGISVSAPQVESHNQTHSFTDTTQQIKVLPAPSALPQWIRVMQLQTLAAALFFPRGDGALVGALWLFRLVACPARRAAL